MVQVFALSLLLQLTTLVLPFFMQLTIDEAVGQSDLDLLGLLLAGFAVVSARQPPPRFDRGSRIATPFQLFCPCQIAP